MNASQIYMLFQDFIPLYAHVNFPINPCAAHSYVYTDQYDYTRPSISLNGAARREQNKSHIQAAIRLEWMWNGNRIRRIATVCAAAPTKNFQDISNGWTFGRFTLDSNTWQEVAPHTHIHTYVCVWWYKRRIVGKVWVRSHILSTEGLILKSGVKSSRKPQWYRSSRRYIYMYI